MLSVNYVNVNGEDGGELKSGFATSEEAEQYIQDCFCGEPEEYEADILQLLQNGEVVAEYSKDDFDC